MEPHLPQAQAGIPPGLQPGFMEQQVSSCGQQPQETPMRPLPEGDIHAVGQYTRLPVPQPTGHVNPGSAKPCWSSDNE